jgi:hypothetical protein
MENEEEDQEKKEEYERKKEISSNGFITPIMFEKFWGIYPRKDGKGKALSKWKSLCQNKTKHVTWIEIKKAILLQKKSERWQTEKYIPLPATWLNQTRWIDDPNEMKNFDKDEFVCPNKFIFGKDFNKLVGCHECEEYSHKTWIQCRQAYKK